MRIQPIMGYGISSNVYLILGQKIALVDAGMHEISGDNIETIQEFTSSIDYLILTHRHVDHIGGARAIVDAFSPRVFAGRRDADAIRKADEITTGSRDFGLSVFPVDVTPLKDGDTINLGDFRLTVLETPGHTAGSISLYGEGGELFSGDTIFADGGIGRWDLPTGDFYALRDSIERLSNLDVRSLYPGHGRYVTEDAKRHMMMALQSINYY